MEFVFNDLSFHGQFATAADAQAALRQLLSLRTLIAKHGLVLRSSQGLLERQLTVAATVRSVINAWRDPALRQSIIIWMTKDGPFWDRQRLHGPDDYFECRGQVVTEHGLAEAAMAASVGQPRELISTSPSAWEETPLHVDWHETGAHPLAIQLWNSWKPDALSVRLSLHQAPLASWADLLNWTRRTCEHLTLASNVIEPLARHPFHPGAVERLQVLLKVLDELKASIGADGKMSEGGMRLREEHFVGDKAWFTDSSDAEKVDFKSDLTFKHPGRTDDTLFCPWHGKVKIDQLRIHFSYPIKHDEPQIGRAHV